MPEIYELPNYTPPLTGEELFPVSDDLTASKLTLNDIAAFINYRPTTVSATNNSGTPLEIGSSKSNVTVSWSIGPTERTIVAQTFDGTTIPAGDRTHLLPGPFTTNTTWTITANDGKTTGTGSTSLEFRYKRYYGASANTTLNDAGIIALSSDLGTQSRAQSRQITCNNEYIYFCWPSSWGGDPNSSFTVNGLLNTSWNLVRNDMFTNASGRSYQIRLYRSQNLVTGTFNLVVS